MSCVHVSCAHTHTYIYIYSITQSVYVALNSQRERVKRPRVETVLKITTVQTSEIRKEKRYHLRGKKHFVLKLIGVEMFVSLNIPLIQHIVVGLFFNSAKITENAQCECPTIKEFPCNNLAEKYLSDRGDRGCLKLQNFTLFTTDHCDD